MVQKSMHGGMCTNIPSSEEQAADHWTMFYLCSIMKCDAHPMSVFEYFNIPWVCNGPKCIRTKENVLLGPRNHHWTPLAKVFGEKVFATLLQNLCHIGGLVERGV